MGGLSDSSQYLGYICSFVSMVCMIVATLIAKAKWDGSDLGAAIAMQTITTALLFLPIALYNGTVWPQLSLPFLGAVAWAIVFATLGGYGLYYVCLARSGAVRTTSLIYVTPGLTLGMGLGHVRSADVGLYLGRPGALFGGRLSRAGRTNRRTRAHRRESLILPRPGGVPQSRPTLVIAEANAHSRRLSVSRGAHAEYSRRHFYRTR